MMFFLSQAVGRYLPKVQQLHLRSNYSIIAASMEALFSYRRPALRQLQLNAECTFPAAILIAVLQKCPALEELRLGVSVDHALWTIDILHDIGFIQRPSFPQSGVAASSGHLLKALSLSLLAQSTATDIGELFSACPNIIQLDLSECEWLDDAVLRAMGAALPALRSINLIRSSSVTDGGLAALLQQPMWQPTGGAPRLEKLHLCGCEELTDAALEVIGRHCPLLRELDIRLCPRIRGPGLEPLAGGCRELAKLYISASVVEHISPDSESLAAFHKRCGAALHCLTAPCSAALTCLIATRPHLAAQ